MELYNNLILIRHAENIIDENLSNSQLSLSDRGVLQAKQAAELLKEKFDIVISSPSKRAIMTANIISKNKEILQDSRLLERGWGNNEQDGKETNEEAKIRFKYFLTETILKYKNKKILLVTHGSLMKLAQDVIEGENITRDSIDNCTIIEYDKNKQKQIIKTLNK